MAKILTTQRQTYLADRAETIDSLDQNWTRLLETAGFISVPVPNATNNFKCLIDPDVIGVLLTGGGDINTNQIERDHLERSLLHYCRASRIPILGICRGAQLIAHEAGWPLENVSSHVGTRHPLFSNPEVSDKLMKCLEDMSTPNVNSFHNYGLRVRNCPSNIEWILKSQDEFAEAFRFRSDLVLGLMWHPERDTPFKHLDISFLRQYFQGELKW